MRAAMRIRLTDPADVDDLIDFLGSRGDIAVEQVAHDELEVSLLGSYNPDALRMQLYLRIRAWEAAHHAKGARVELDA